LQVEELRGELVVLAALLTQGVLIVLQFRLEERYQLLTRIQFVLEVVDGGGRLREDLRARVVDCRRVARRTRRQEVLRLVLLLRGGDDAHWRVDAAERGRRVAQGQL